MHSSVTDLLLLLQKPFRDCRVPERLIKVPSIVTDGYRDESIVATQLVLI